MTRRAPSQTSKRRSDSDGPTVVIVGAGIVGLAHAWAAAKRGCKVIVLERDVRARGASVRNFGMVWPIGQPNGLNHSTALASRRLWLEFLRDSQTWHQESGSLHLAYRDDELAVLRDFAKHSRSVGYECELLDATETANRTPAVDSQSLLGALWSPTEVGVNPRQVIHEMPSWLADRFGVEFHFGVAVTHADRWAVSSADGTSWRADRVIIAAGADFRVLFPDLYREAGFTLCKLQMMRTVPQPDNWKLGPMIASGLTLRHYESFSICKSLQELKQRIAEETPELDDFGIHVMAAQNEQGELILGDSHEYGDHVSPYDRRLIDDLILRELREIIDLPTWKIGEHWHGVYAKVPNSVEYFDEVEENLHVAIASGGCGMTMSFGLAEQHWQHWLPSSQTSQTATVDARVPIETELSMDTTTNDARN